MKRVVFVFGWLVVGGEETEVRHLARHLDRERWGLEVIPCQQRPGMPEQTHDQLEALGVPVDRTPYTLSFEDTVQYLARRLHGADLVVACQAVPDVYPALELLEQPPPLVEHGGLVEEATAGPKHRTARYVGVCAAIRDAAASVMRGREHDAVAIPSMVDLAEFSPASRLPARAAWGFDEETPVVGWVGRLDRKKRVEDLLHAARLVRERGLDARFVLIGGPDAFMPEYAEELRRLAAELDLDSSVLFLGDRPDVPDLLAGLDVLAWLSQGEGMPHVVAEAGAASLAVVVTHDNGSVEQVADGVSGLVVPHGAPKPVADALERLLRERELRLELGRALRRKVEREYSVEVVVPRWERLFDEVLAEAVR